MFSLADIDSLKPYQFAAVFAVNTQKDKLSKELIKQIRDALNKAWVLGEDRFKKQIEPLTGKIR